MHAESDLIISEYQMLNMKYKAHIRAYKEAIARMTLKQVINNEEVAWIRNKDALARIEKEQEERDSFEP